ncbi:unnamed protein product, partial [Mesorhabditis spiculigera]
MKLDCYLSCARKGAKYVVYFLNATCQCFNKTASGPSKGYENITASLLSCQAAALISDFEVDITSYLNLVHSTSTKSTAPTTTTACPSTWTEWVEITPCTASCGMYGTLRRNRSCILAESGCQCSGSGEGAIACPDPHCTFPVEKCADGNFSAEPNGIALNEDCYDTCAARHANYVVYFLNATCQCFNRTTITNSKNLPYITDSSMSCENASQIEGFKNDLTNFLKTKFTSRATTRQTTSMTLPALRFLLDGMGGDYRLLCDLWNVWGSREEKIDCPIDICMGTAKSACNPAGYAKQIRTDAPGFTLPVTSDNSADSTIPDELEEELELLDV